MGGPPAPVPPFDPPTLRERVAPRCRVPQVPPNMALGLDYPATAWIKDMPEQDPILEQVQSQIAWYESKSLASRRAFRRIRLAVFSFAALIPLVAVLNWRHSSWVVGGLGVVLVVSVAESYIYQTKSILYRLTYESLNREKQLFLSREGPYRGEEDPRALLARMIESLVGQEHAAWGKSIRPTQLSEIEPPVSGKGGTLTKRPEQNRGRILLPRDHVTVR